jgi:hypothetical protein
MPLSGSLIYTGDQDVGTDGRGDGDDGQPGKGRVCVHDCLFLLLNLSILVGSGGLSVRFKQGGVRLELSVQPRSVKAGETEEVGQVPSNTYLEVEVKNVDTEQDDRGAPAQSEQALEGTIGGIGGTAAAIGTRADEVPGRSVSATVTGRSSVGRMVWRKDNVGNENS